MLLRAVSMTVRPRTRGVKCLLCVGDDVLLVRHAYGPGLWDLPGGFCRRREPFEAAARREVAEELAVDDARWTDVGELRRRFQGRHETLRIFRAELTARAVSPSSREVAEVRWFPRGGLPEQLAPIVRAVTALEAGLTRAERG